jgi:hypothetical protein
MDPWRIGLLVMAAIFIVFIVLRLRPRMPADEPDGETEEFSDDALTEREKRLLKRLKKLPPDGRQRLFLRLGQMIDADDEQAEDDVDEE